jgi:hypothetical protein
MEPVFLAWMGSWEAKGYKIVAVDTTTEVCTSEEKGAAKEILEKMIKKSLVKSKSGMPQSPPENFVLPLSQWANKAFKVRFVIIDFI